MKDNKEKLYTLEESAVMLKVSYPWLRSKIVEGLVHTQTVKPPKGRKKVIIKESELIRFKKSLEEDPKEID